MMMLRCACPSAVTRHQARPAPARIAAAAGRVAVAPCVSAKRGVAAVRRRRLGRCCGNGGVVRARAAVDLESSPPPLFPGSSSQQQQHGDGSFVPLQVNYSERFSAAGRTTGSFFKRDGRPKDSETLVSRLVDRPLRPNFEKGWSAETQVLLWVVSYDGVHSPEPLAITAAGAALAVSDIPLAKAVVGARVALLPVRE